METVLRAIHFWVRYGVLLAGLVAIAVAAMNWSKPAASGAERASTAAFTGLLDLQFVLGLAMLLVVPFYGALTGHIVTMLLAVVVAHAGSVAARRREPARSGSPVRVGAIVLALVLIAGGLMAIGRPVV